jgi:ATP-binding cassette, subfamily B, bacterial PglK
MLEFIYTIRKTYDLLTATERKNAFFLLFIILITALLDMLGIASILPFITVLANPQMINSNEFLNNIYQISSIIGVNNEKQFLFMLGIMAFILLVISLTFRALTQYYLLRFSLKREHTIGKRIIEGYLHQPYSWFLTKNSADLGKNILSEVNIVIQQSIIPILNLFAQSAVIIAITILLIIVDPILSLSTGLVLGFSYLSLFYFIKKILSRLGAERLQANLDRFSVVSESFGAIKEIKIKSLENIYISKFSKPSEVYTKNQSLAAMIAHLPRFFFEGIAFGGMIIIILVLMAKDSGFTNILPIITLYAFAGYRLLPALQHIYASLTQMRFSKSALDTLHNDLISLNSIVERNSKNYLENRISFEKSIDINRINFQYPNSKQDIIKDLTFSIPVSRKIAIVGTTGSGKSTTVDIILGLLDPIDGSLRVDGKIIDNNNKRSWQKMIGYVPQQIYLSDESVAANIAFGVEKKNINQEAVEQAAKLANLHEFVIKELDDKYDTTIGERGIRLSGGQRQRIGIARALYHKPKVMIFDEATSALDNITEKAVMEAIYNLESSITVILITHRMSTVKEFDKIILLDKGSLKAQGSFKELNQKNMIFKKMTGKI